MAPASRNLTELIERLQGGAEPAPTEIALFSDLDRSEVPNVRSKWLEIPAATRQSLLDRANELAEENIELDFSQLALVAVKDPEAKVRAAGARGLWESESRSVGELLANLVANDPDGEVRAAAADSLSQFVVLAACDELPAADAERIVSALRGRAEDRAEERLVRAAALDALGPLGAEWLEPLITEAYESGDREMRLSALHAMADSCDERWLEYVHEQFYSDDASLRFSAVLATGEIASEDSIEPLAAMLDDEDPAVVLAAVDSLGNIGGEEAVQLLEALASRAPEEAAEVLEAALTTAREGGIWGFGPEGDEDA